jgi:tetratricopeptide (TPR) repeat protein
METESIVDGLEKVLTKRTGSRLNHLQRLILRQVWQGLKYREIAADSGYTEGHIKDVGSDLWKLLSKVFDAKITKSNCKAVVKRYLQSAGLYTPGQLVAPLGNKSFSHNAPEITPLVWSDLDEIETGPVVANPSVSLLGRSQAMLQLQQLVQQQHPVIVIQGEGGLGKTTLAQHYLHSQGFEFVLELLMAKESQHITPIERVVEEWLRQDFNVEPGQEFGVSLARLKRQLESRRVGILIDNLEPALDAQGRLSAAHRRYLELLRVLGDRRIQAVTIITSRDRVCEPDANLVHYRLPGLPMEAWREFFQARGIGAEANILTAMCRAYGGNAKAMGILAGVIQMDFDRDLTAYWSSQQSHETNTLLVEPDLHHLIASQMQRLQQLDPIAYQLLCRLGCYRYQDVPTLSSDAAMAMLWDIPEAQRRQVLRSLQHRSLLETSKGEYWLHPAVREAAIAQLRLSQDWENSHRFAATFWTESVQQITTKQDALMALEAYHHYVTIADWESAATVILKSRHNQWKQHLPLGSMLYRMGFVQPVLGAIDSILPQLKSTKSLAELNNILGDLHWIAGQVHAAIACQERTIALATAALRDLDQSDRHGFYYFRMLEVDGLLSLGLYNIDLGELATAAQLFQQVISKAENSPHRRWAEKAIVCLALVLSYQGELERAAALVQNIDQILTDRQNQTGSIAYFLQILAQTYINLGQVESAQVLYEQALQSAVTGEYPQIKARSLNGLAQVYRLQQNWAEAIGAHLAAIELLETIGAKCDLAEACWQLGLSYRALGEGELAERAGDRSLRLFGEMGASKQLQRITLFMSNSS